MQTIVGHLLNIDYIASIDKKILWWGVIIWILPTIDSIIGRKMQEIKEHTFDYNRLQQYTIMYLKIMKLSRKQTFIEI